MKCTDMPYREVEKQIYKMIDNVVDEWFTKQANDIFSKYHLYYKPSNKDAWGILTVLSEYDINDKAYVLAANEHINRGFDKRNAWNWIKPIVMRLPILPTE